MFLYYYYYFLFCSCLEKSLKNLRTECHWLTSMSWDLCARCDLCPGKVDENGLCHWHKKTECSHADCAHYISLERSPLCCRYVVGDCCLLPQDSFQPWIQVNEVEASMFGFHGIIGILYYMFYVFLHLTVKSSVLHCECAVHFTFHARHM